MSQDALVAAVLGRYAGTSLFLYDILITLDDEIAFVWTSGWTAPKVLYFFNRYFGLAFSIFSSGISVVPMSPNFCYRFNWFSSTWLVVAASIADFYLLLRVLALVQRRRRVCLVLKVLYGVVYSIEFALLCYYLSTQVEALTEESYGNNLGCVTTTLTGNQSALGLGNAVLPIACAPILLLNVAYLSIVLVNLAPYCRATEGNHTPILTTFVRDGVMYFLLFASAAGFLVYTPIAFYDQPRLQYMSLPWFLAISPVAAGRLFLNLRAAAGRLSPQLFTAQVVQTSEGRSSEEAETSSSWTLSISELTSRFSGGDDGSSFTWDREG